MEFIRSFINPPPLVMEPNRFYQSDEMFNVHFRCRHTILPTIDNLPKENEPKEMAPCHLPACGGFPEFIPPVLLETAASLKTRGVYAHKGAQTDQTLFSAISTVLGIVPMGESTTTECAPFSGCILRPPTLRMEILLTICELYEE